MLIHYEFDNDYIEHDRWVGPNDGMVILDRVSVDDIDAAYQRLAEHGKISDVQYVWNTEFPA
jgi:hypothetical protein